MNETERSFSSRIQAGRLLARELEFVKGSDIVIYGLPRGGVVTAVEVAKYLRSPLELLLTRKITHPLSPEYAQAAISEKGYLVSDKISREQMLESWFEEAVQKQVTEIARRRLMYSEGKKRMRATGKTAIIVDDGVATGLTLRAGILEIKDEDPLKLIVAVPVIPESTAELIKSSVDNLITLLTPSDKDYLGAVGSYYEDFHEVSDQEVMKILQEFVYSSRAYHAFARRAL